jgi:small subunit ribosomal protein S5
MSLVTMQSLAVALTSARAQPRATAPRMGKISTASVVTPRGAIVARAGDDDVNDESETDAPRGRRGGRGGGRGRGGRGGRGEKVDDYNEAVVQVSRVTKVTKGGSQMSFRATVVVGDGKGSVGVGCKKAKEVQIAVTKAAADARKSCTQAPITKGATFPHRVTIKGKGGAVVMLRPAAPGTGVIAGGACRTVLELAGYKNCFAKQLGSSNPLNNARAVVAGLAEMRTFKEVAKVRDMTLEELFSA